jgi:hypothetical protein
MIELGQILDGLVQRTTEGKLRWSRTVAKDRFVTSVDAISVAIVDAGPIPEVNYETFRESYRLDILDESGDVVDSLGFKDTTGEQDQLLERLYVLARRSALNVDSVLEKLAKGLEL